MGRDMEIVMGRDMEIVGAYMNNVIKSYNSFGAVQVDLLVIIVIVGDMVQAIVAMHGMAIGKMARSLAPKPLLGIILGFGIVPKLDI